jgi:hypothetical protein
MFGIMVAVNGTFTAVQNAIKSWSKAECLGGFTKTSNITGPILVTAPPLIPIPNNTISNQHSSSNTTKSTLFSNLFLRALRRRDDCRAIQVVSGDDCPALATKCGISLDDFMRYNPKEGLCPNLRAYMYVCCSPGDMPDFSPKPNAVGSCATYTVAPLDECYAIAQTHGLLGVNLDNFNSGTWGWTDCADLRAGIVMCLSTGTPPMPASISTAVCGPLVPGTALPPPGT